MQDEVNLCKHITERKIKMTIKNVMKKPTVTITKLGPKPKYMEQVIYEHLHSKLNTPLPVSTLSYFEDGRICSISVFLPELQYIIEDSQPPCVACEHATFFNDGSVDMTLSYVD